MSVEMSLTLIDMGIFLLTAIADVTTAGDIYSFGMCILEVSEDRLRLTK